MISMEDEFKIQGQVSLDLSTYEGIKNRISVLEKRDINMKKRVRETQEASKELASFLNHLARAVGNFDDLVSAFNSSAEGCEIQKTDDNKYLIKLNMDK